MVGPHSAPQSSPDSDQRAAARCVATLRVVASVFLATVLNLELSCPMPDVLVSVCAVGTLERLVSYGFVHL